jgi:hypothetical protein
MNSAFKELKLPQPNPRRASARRNRLLPLRYSSSAAGEPNDDELGLAGRLGRRESRPSTICGTEFRNSLGNGPGKRGFGQPFPLVGGVEFARGQGTRLGGDGERGGGLFALALFDRFA